MITSPPVSRLCARDMVGGVIVDESLYRKILRYVPMFRSLTSGELEAIVAISQLFRVREGTLLIREGEEARAMYVLVEGKVRVFKQIASGDKTVLADLEAPSVFGEMALIDRAPRSAHVGTLSDAILYQVDLKEFNRLRDEMHPGAYKILRELAMTLCGRVRAVGERIGRFFDDPERTAQELTVQFIKTGDTGSQAG